jgi:hypothetical protein
MIELAGNLHVHSAYSDGRLYHGAIAAAAARAGLDFLFVTDHNVYVRGVDRWHSFEPDRRVLLLAGEEIHHQDRVPQKNHLLVLGARSELGGLAADPQVLLDAVRAAGGASFLAHPFDPASALIGEAALGWVSWDVTGYDGLEIWNYMSEFKSLMRGRAAALLYIFLPGFGIRSPDPATVAAWDRLLSSGRRVVAVGGADAHGQVYAVGPLRRTILPYEYLFRAVNMHVLLDGPLSGDADADGGRIVAALRRGSAWVANDLPASTRGFRFDASGQNASAGMGGEIALRSAPVLTALLPARARGKISRAGAGPVQEGTGTEVVFRPTGPGAYRLEAWRRYRGRLRGWIFSNPIHVV